MKPAGLFTFLFVLIATSATPIVAEAIDRRAPYDDTARIVARMPKKKKGSGSSAAEETGAASFARPANIVNLGGVGVAGAVVIAALI